MFRGNVITKALEQKDGDKRPSVLKTCSTDWRPPRISCHKLMILSESEKVTKVR